MRVVFVLCILTVLVTGCGTAAHSSSSSARRVEPTVLRWGLVGLSDIPTLDPALASDATSMSVSSLVYGGLVRLDYRLRVRPDGAARWTISRNGKMYTFHLRSTLRFPDGLHVTASDFVAALRRSLGPEGAAGTAPAYLHDIARDRSGEPAVVALNPSTLRITLTQPAAHFLAALAFPGSQVVERSVLTRYGPNWTNHAAGFGPFFVRSWEHGRRLILARNPYYYAGKPRLKLVTIGFYGNQKSAIAAYGKAELDLISGFQAGQTPLALPVGARRIPGLALDYLAFNTARLPFFRLNARRAFASVWKPALVLGAMKTTAFPATSFLPPGFGLLLPEWTPSAKPLQYLSGARYPHGRNFPHVIFLVPRESHVSALATKLSELWWSKLGLDVPVRQLNPSDYSTLINAHAFDIAIVRWGADYPDPQDFLATQLGSSSDNITGWTRPSFDTAIRTADSYSPLDLRRIALFREAGSLAAQKIPLLPLDEPAMTAVIRPSVHDIALTPLGTITGNWARAGFG